MSPGTACSDYDDGDGDIDDDDDDDDDQDELGFWSCGRRHLLPATVIFWPSNIQYDKESDQ